MSQLPPCPECQSPYAYEDRGHLNCPECGHEWQAGEEIAQADGLIVKDAHGALLQSYSHFWCMR